MPQDVAEVSATAWRGVVVLTLAAALLVAVPGVADADLTLLPDETWGVVNLYDSPHTATPSEVMAIEQIGNTIYVGGQFLEVVRRRNDPHFDQPFLAAFDATSGEWIDWWRPDVDGPVFALEASPDGKRLYVGGEFTNVNGIGDTEGLVALNPATGRVDPGFTAQIEGVPGSPSPGIVRAIKATASWLYIGGSFNWVTGPDPSSRMRANKTARLSANGTPDTSWRPRVLDGSVRGLDVDVARNRVYLTGFFESIDNVPDTGNFVAVSGTTGAPITTLNRFPVLTPEQPHQFEVLVDGDSVWVVGTQHLVHKLHAADLSIDRRWMTGFEPGFDIGGDFQALGVLGDEIYATCHCWGVIRELPDSVETLQQALAQPVDGEVQGIIGFDRETGQWNSGFVPDILGQTGGWAVHGAGDGCLWVGGDLNRRKLGDQWRNGIVRWCDQAGPGPPVAPPLQEPPDRSEQNRPSRPGNLTAGNGPGDDIVLSWTASTDDTAVATYVVYRDGLEEARTRRTQLQLAPGGKLSVQAIDTWGNRSGYGDPVSTVAPVAPVWGYWPLDGGAIDMTGRANHGVVSGARNVPGRIIDAHQLKAGDSIRVAPNDDLKIGADNGDFTVSAWLRLETGPTGAVRQNISAAGVATIGTAAPSNRVIAAVTASTGDKTVTSSQALALQTWTHVALVRSGTALRLYIDGKLDKTASISGTTAAGSGALTLRGATARLDDVVVHGGALTTAQVAAMATPDFPEALWAYYPLDGDAADESGNGFDGVVLGTTAAPGVHGKGLRFNGTAADQVVIADDPALRPGENDGDFTVSFWMNLQSGATGTWRSITHKGNLGSQRTFAMWMRPSENRLHFDISTVERSDFGGDSLAEIPVGDWTHVAYVKRANKFTLYLNGRRDNSFSLTSDVIANDGDIYIGDTPWFNGTAMIVDDYRIYSHGFDDAEARALAGTAEPPKPSGPPVRPIVDIVRPRPGTVTKTVTVAVDATSAVDALGSLDVEVKVGGKWKPATWHAASETYRYQWNTTKRPPGQVIVRARAEESTGTIGTAKPVEVLVDAHYPSVVLADRPVAYWRLDDGGTFARDSAGGDNRARYNSTTTQTAPLIADGGKSATFDGNDLITIANDDNLNTAPSYKARTVELWFRATDAAGRHVLWEEGGSQHGIAIYTKGGRIHAGAWNRTAPNAWADDVFVKYPFEPGAIHHVVLVVKPNSGHLNLFVDGVKARQRSGIGPIGSHADAIGLGGRNGSVRFHDRVAKGGTGAHLKGVIDEVAIYNKALGRSAVQLHYAAGRD